MKPRARQGIIVLASGGVESCMLLRFLARAAAVYPLYIRSGYVWEKAEMEHLKRFLAATRHKNIRPLVALDFPLREIHPSHWGITGRGVPDAYSQDKEVELPGRNIFLLSLAAAYASSRGVFRIALGTLKSNPFPDARSQFFRRMERLLEEAYRQRFRILTPFSRLKKSQAIERYGKALPLHLTFSCLSPRPNLKPCRACNKCAERQSALGVSKITLDKTEKIVYNYNRGKTE